MSATALSENRLAVAVLDIDGKLRLSIWDISADGQSVKKAIPDSDDELRIGLGGDDGETQIVTATPTESVFNVAITAVGSSRLIAAVSDSDQNLKLIVWDVAPDGGITRKAEVSSADSPFIQGVSSTTPELFFSDAIDILTLSSNQVATAHRATDGTLWVTAWELIEVRGNVLIDRQGSGRGVFRLLLVSLHR